MKHEKTYLVNHPYIEEISIGDKFITNNGRIFTFIECNKFGHFWFSLEKEQEIFSSYGVLFNLDLKQCLYPEIRIEHKIPSLKDKIDLL